MNALALSGKKKLNISLVGDVALRMRKVSIARADLNLLRKNFEYLKKQSERHVIYGLNTGFGPMARVYVAKTRQTDLQYNLIRSHALGLGSPVSPEQSRAIMMVRLQTLLQAHSAIGEEACMLLAEFLNRGISPVIPSHGSVGASGDLVQLAHVAEALIGEGKVMHDGKIIATRSLFAGPLARAGISPLTVKLREGLALMNGTSAMTGIGALNVLNAKILLHYSLLASAAMFEITASPDSYFSELISSVRPHKGQVRSGEIFRRLLKDSKRIRKDDSVSFRLTSVESYSSKETAYMDRSRQEVYSVRCAVQVLGPMLDAVTQAEDVVVTEMNSVTDNPVVFTGSSIIHGGNFHGDYVSYEMDKLKIAFAKLAVFSERKLAFLLNDKVNGILPPFLNSGVIGLDLGFQGLQFVATSTAAESQSLSSPVSVHSISCNNDNQDIVSMGTNSALAADKVISNAFEVVAIELAAVQRAVSILGIRKSLSRSTRELCSMIESCLTSKGDLVKRDDIQRIIDAMRSTESLLMK